MSNDIWLPQPWESLVGEPVENSKLVASLKRAKPEYVVAAADTPTELKKSADYVCDGTDDQVEINTAVDLLGSNGGQVRYLPGNYYAEEIKLVPGVWHVGDHFSVTITLNAGPDKSLFRHQGTVSNYWGGGVTGLMLEGGSEIDFSRVALHLAGVTSRAEDFVFDECRISNFGMAYYCPDGGEREVLIRRIVTRNCLLGLVVREHPMVTDCDLRGGLVGLTGNIYDMMVRNNKFIDNRIGVAGLSGIYTPTSSTSSSVTVTGEVWGSTRISSWIIFARTGNAYRVTAIPSADTLTVEGNPSAETGQFVLVGQYNFAQSSFEHNFFGGNRVRDIVLGHWTRMNFNMHWRRPDITHLAGIQISGNDVHVSNAYFTVPSGTIYDYTDGCVDLAPYGGLSTHLVSPVIRDCFFQGDNAIITMSHYQRINNMQIVGNMVKMDSGQFIKQTKGMFYDSTIANNMLYLSGSSVDPLIDCYSANSKSNVCQNNRLFVNGSPTAPGLVGGDWSNSSITGNHCTGSIPAVDPTANVTSATVSNHEI